MARRVTNEEIGTHVSNAILAAGTDVPEIAQATGLDPAELTARLQGVTAFTFGELVQIGGFLHVAASDLLKEDAA